MKIRHLGSCFCLLILFFFTSVSPVEAAADSSRSIILEPDVTYVHPGDVFTVTVSIDPQSMEVYGVQYNVSFDPDAFEILSQSQGPFLSQDGRPAFVVRETYPEKGEVLYVESRYGIKTGVSAPGIVSTIEFRVKDPISSYGVKEFILNNVIIVDSNLQITGFDPSSGTVVLIGPVVSGFTPSVSEGEAPLTVKFTDTSMNAVSWSWDFNGDGLVDSRAQNPEFTYTEPGEYVVSLTAANKLGTGDTSTQSILVTGPQVYGPPVINSVDLFPARTTPGAAINVSVDVVGEAEVIEVAVGDVLLVKKTDGIWQGSIIAPSSPGDYSLSIAASDAAGSTAETSVPYHVVLCKGGVDISISPGVSFASSGNTVSLTLKVKNTQNIDDIFNVRINTDRLRESLCADLSGFSWTENEVKLRAGEEKIFPLEVRVPVGASRGLKFFRANVDSEMSAVYGFDKGLLIVS